MPSFLSESFSLFGGSSTEVKTLNKMITDTTTSVMTKMSSTGTGNISSSQSVVATGGGTVSGVSLDQAATIDLTVLADSKTNAKMQSDLTNKLVNKITNENSALPVQFSNQDNSTDIRNIVDNHVSANLGSKALAKMQLGIKQDQSVAAIGEGSLAENIKLAQKADAIGRLINTMSNDMTNDLISNNDLDTNAAAKNTSAVADMFGSLMDSISGIFNSIFTMSPGFVIMVIAAVLGVVALGYFGMRRSGAAAAKTVRFAVPAKVSA